jgi:hypothetical protein
MPSSSREAAAPRLGVVLLRVKKDGGSSPQHVRYVLVNSSAKLCLFSVDRFG